MASSPKNDITTIRVSTPTHELLKKKKRGGESFEDMIKRRFRL